MRPSDEELMAYADGELDTDAHARVAAAVAADPGLAKKVEAFASTGRSLGTLFDTKLAEPPPDRLLDLLQAPPTATPVVTPMRKPRQVWLPFALAASLALGVAIGVNWSSPDTPATTMAGLPDDGRISAVLERTASGEPAMLTAGPARIEIMPTSTYREASGRWCREFRATSLDNDARTLGVACRSGSDAWTTEVAISDAYVSLVQDEGFFAASGEPTLHGGTPVSPREEAALISRGWKD